MEVSIIDVVKNLIKNATIHKKFLLIYYKKNKRKCDISF